MTNYDIKIKYLMNNWKKLKPSEAKALAGNLSWTHLCKTEKLEEKFILKFEDWILWDFLAMNPNLTEDLILKFKDRFYIPMICGHQKLREEFIFDNLDIFMRYIPIILQYQSLDYSARNKLLMLQELNK